VNFHKYIDKYIVLALAGLLVGPVATRADTINLDFSYTDDYGLVSGDATLDATLISPGVYFANSGSLDLTAPAADGVAGIYQLISTPAASNPLYSPTGLFVYDEFVLPGSDPAGANFGVLAFGAPGDAVNFFSYGPGDYAVYSSYTVADNDPESYSPPGTVAATRLLEIPDPVPDGGMTVALLGLSLVGLAGAEALRRKFSG